MRRLLLSMLPLALINAGATTSQAASYHLTDLGLIGGGQDINNLGQVAVGHSLWVNGIVTDLGQLPGGGSDVNGVAINQQTQIVGRAQASTGGTHAFVWDPVNGMQDLERVFKLHDSIKNATTPPLWF
jgi:probable HAF family extracellular repeat protein